MARNATHRSTSWSGERQPLPKSTRRRILTRDAGVCQLCGGARCANQALQVDHRTPHAEGGTDHDHNLWAIGAHPCHTEKTRAEQARGQARRNPTRPAEPHPGLIEPPPLAEQPPQPQGTPQPHGHDQAKRQRNPENTLNG